MLDEVLEDIKNLRRTYSRIILESLEGSSEYEIEDTIRLVGHLQASYDHLLASKSKGNDDFYCVIGKHLPACIILMGEIGTDVGPIYTILSKLTDGKIKPCQACEKDKNGKN